MAFPKDFMIGAASAGHQVEGNNSKSDTWAMEHMKYGGYKELSGDAADHYHTYREDMKKMADAGLNAYRFSFEWPRIEPEEGVFDEAEMDHYLDMVHACREYGLEPIVTIMHFTSPVWLISKGGWEADSTVEDFAKYVRYVCEHLKGENLKYLCTLNEANMGTLIAGYIAKIMAGKNAGQLQIGMDLEKAMEEERLKKEECQSVFGVDQAAVFCSPRTDHGNEIIGAAHQAAVAVIHEVLPGVKAGWSLSISDIQAIPGGEENAAAESERIFGQFLPYMKDDDFFGVQSYTRNIFGPEGELPPAEDAELTQMNYEYYPEGVAHVVREAAKVFPKDLIVTENGIATADDTRRCAFIKTALEGLEQCVADGIPLKGYMYWSMIDNYEWESGYSMQFGLMGLNRETQEHPEKPSLALLGSYTK